MTQPSNPRYIHKTRVIMPKKIQTNFLIYINTLIFFFFHYQMWHLDEFTFRAIRPCNLSFASLFFGWTSIRPWQHSIYLCECGRGGGNAHLLRLTWRAPIMMWHCPLADPCLLSNSIKVYVATFPDVWCRFMSVCSPYWDLGPLSTILKWRHWTTWESFLSNCMWLSELSWRYSNIGASTGLKG